MNKSFTLGIFICLLTLFAGCRALLPWQDDVTTADDESVLYPVKEEMRAVWVATVANIDWPSKPGLAVDIQQEELIRIMDRAAALNLNAIIFQVRPAADAMYDSPYEPWASYLNGNMGDAPLPAYDPLEFAIREAHNRGLELHAWFNPFRAGHPSDTSDISPDHISKTNPELVLPYGDYLWLDPGIPEARDHSRKVIMDVVERYDIDGVHFDDYFYPYRAYADGDDFPDDASWQRALEEGTELSRSDWRRNNVDRFIAGLYNDIKQTKPDVKFGISPFGIWQPDHPRLTTGFNAYDELYADARLWLHEGWVDYFTPQIYYRTDQTAQPYPVMLQWWGEQNNHNRHLWPGIYTSRIVTENPNWPGNEITGQIFISRGFPGVTGAVHFSMQALMRNPDRFRDQLAAGPYIYPALVPPSPWLDSSRPSPPGVSVREYDGIVSLRIEPSAEDRLLNWVMKTRFGKQWYTQIIPASHPEVNLSGNPAEPVPDEVMISTVNRTGNKSRPVRESISGSRNLNNDYSLPDFDNLITRKNWSADSPGGYSAGGLRIHTVAGDTLHFRDLSVVIGDAKPGPVILHRNPDQYSTDILTENHQADSIRIQLFRHGVTETFRIPQGDAFNWYGYHISVLDIKPEFTDFGKGEVTLEIASVSELPVNRAALMETGGYSQRIRIPHTIQKITLHHTGPPKAVRADEDIPQKLQDLQQWSREQKNWWDLPYHFLVDLHGNIYEGRNLTYAGEANGMYDPRGHLQIAFFGNYDLQEPTPEQKVSFEKLTDWAKKAFDIPGNAIHPAGEFTNTSSPGSHLRRWLDEERK